MTVNTDIFNQAGLSAPQTATTPETGVQTIDQAGFLKLMTTQLHYQDPFAPMDNNQMVQQMATFTSLENQNSGNKLLQGISDSLTGTRLSDAANWIGKSMLVKSDIATPDRTGAYAGELTLDKDSPASPSTWSMPTAIRSSRSTSAPARPAPPASSGTAPMTPAIRVAPGPLKVQVRGGSTTQIATWASIAAVQSPASGADARLITSLGNFQPSDALRLG